ncbi:hypothetical protein B0919_06045 [Hymenobacter sp. CRA2]|nr:hypothetical protein B0919_06045 [Hymenobacter sp. CRA2]
MSNVDSFQFKDFNTPTRWEHCISVAYLANYFADIAKLNEFERVHLVLAALFHDIATPPFAHTMEYVLNDFDHELESYRILSYKESDNINHAIPVFASQLPRFNKIASSVSKQFGIAINIEEVARLVIGEGKWGFAIKGTLDLDNIDNVTRASMYMGIKINRSLPLKLVEWLANQTSSPAYIKKVDNKCVQEWLYYRYCMYKSFYNSTEEELGRQAFLQHLIRRLTHYGLSRTSLIFNTDDGLLNLMENIENGLSVHQKNGQHFSTSLKDLVLQYRLLADTHKIVEINIEDESELRIINNPLFSEWLEDHLKSNHFEPFVFVKKRRYNEDTLLLPLPAGCLMIFKVSATALKHSHLPNWMQTLIPKETSGDLLSKKINECVNVELKKWLKSKPWHKLSTKRVEDIRTNLNSIQNWDFKLSKNELVHSYPATFVHAIPASLIAALGLKGDTILDPFGGSGVTAMECIKQGCKVHIADVNSVSHMIMKSKFSYLNAEEIAYLKNISKDIIKKQHDKSLYPKRADIVKWHNPDTLKELSRIKSFIDSTLSDNIKLFLTTCFSDILNSSTERRGRDFAYFADNTPLPKGVSAPEYVDAISLFVNKIHRNIQITERAYALLEQQGKEIKSEFERIKVHQLDAKTISAQDLGILPNSIDAIITSPPYLCMVDYTYGNRLPYYWLFPEAFDHDHAEEIGARRRRNNPVKAKQSYLRDMRAFARNSKALIKPGGYLATVIGSPLAQTWAESNIVDEVYQIFEEEGFQLMWSHTRQIQWHRNHGLAKLKAERIAVHINTV